MNLIFGAAGFAKEVDWLIHEIYTASKLDYRTDFFVAEDDSALVGTTINSHKVLSEKDVFSRYAITMPVNIFVAVGLPKIKEKIVHKINNFMPLCQFPNLIHPDVTYDDRDGKVIMGKGNIICSKNVLTTDITLGDFVHINLDCTVGHDTEICDFSTLSPGVNVSGNVSIGEKVYIGTAAVIIEHIKVCSEAVIGAGAIVVRNIEQQGTYIGIPARMK